jgi:hypothetical protein
MSLWVLSCGVAVIATWFWRTADSQPPVAPTPSVTRPTSAPAIDPASAPASTTAGVLNAIAVPGRADAKPHRASPQQRQADRDAWMRDPDLAVLAADLKARAGTGDADAAQALSHLNEYCHAAALYAAGGFSFDEVWRVYRDTAGVTDAELTSLRRELVDGPRRCGSLIKLDTDRLDELAHAWRRRAAELGHPAARMREHAVDQRTDYTPEQQANVDQLARVAAAELLREEGPSALARHQDWLAHISPYSRTALALAACQLMPACVADPVRFDLSQANLRTLQGSEGGWAGWLHASPRELEVARVQAADLMRWWHEGRFDQIVRGSELPGRP